MKAEEYETQPAEDSKVNSFGLLMYFTYVLWPAKHLKGIVVEWHFGSWIPLFIYLFLIIIFFFCKWKVLQNKCSYFNNAFNYAFLKHIQNTKKKTLIHACCILHLHSFVFLSLACRCKWMQIQGEGWASCIPHYEKLKFPEPILQDMWMP